MGPCGVFWEFVLQWPHNERDDVSNHQPHDCLLNHLFRRRSKKTSKLRVTGLCAEIYRWPVNCSHKGPVTLKMFPFDDVILEDLFNHNYHIVSSNVRTARTNTICVWRHYLINRSVITKNGKMVAMEKVWYILARSPKVSRSHKGQLLFSFRWSFVRWELYVISGILRLGTVEWNSLTESMPYELVISDTKPTLPIWLSVSLYWEITP